MTVIGESTENERFAGRELLKPGAAAAILLVMAVSLTLNLSRLGAGSLFGDEAIYAIVARNAAIHGHWYPLIFPKQLHSGSERFFVSKPPLSGWMPALSFSLLGVDERDDRLPSALAGVAVAVLTCAFATWLFDSWTGALAGLLLATCRPWLFTHGAREGVADTLITLMLSATLLLYLHYRSTGKGAWLLAAGVAAGLGTLFKGPIVLLLSFAITLSWELVTRAGDGATREGGSLKRWAQQLARAFASPASLILIGSIPYALWFLDYLKNVPGFAASLQKENLDRVLHGFPGHVHGAILYFDTLRQAFGIWWIGLALAVPAFVRLQRTGGRRARAALLVLLWAAIGIGCLFLSAAKQSWYLDPAFPAVTVLLASGFGEVGRYLGRRARLRLLLGLAIAGLLVGRGIRAWQILSEPARVNPMQRLVLTVHQRPEARFYLDTLGANVGLIREWNQYYITLLDDALRPLPPTLDRRICTFVLTTNAPRLLARPDFAGAQLVAADRPTSKEPDLEIVDLCGGVVAGKNRTSGD